MYPLWLPSTLCLLVLTSAAPPRGGAYSVTILNDSSVGDLSGAVHTWLCIQGPLNKTYFSFTSAEFKHGLGGTTTPGKSSVDEKLRRRTANEKLTINISRRQYETMLQAIHDFYHARPRYSLLPRDNSSYNCVTAANRILAAANIHLLRGYRDPVRLGLRLATVGSVLHKCLASPNIFMFLSFSFFSTLCLFL